jgi:hypothetical protein
MCVCAREQFHSRPQSSYELTHTRVTCRKMNFRKLGNLVRIYDGGEPITLILRYIALLLIIFHPLWHMLD